MPSVRAVLTALTVSLLVAAALAIPLSANHTTPVLTETPSPFATYVDIAIDFAVLSSRGPQTSDAPGTPAPGPRSGGTGSPALGD